MSETLEVYTVTPTLINTKYHSNPNFESIRQGMIALLNSYDPKDSVIDNSTQVKKEAIKHIEFIIEDALEELEQMKLNDLSMSCYAKEQYIKGCHDCLERIKDYL